MVSWLASYLTSDKYGEYIRLSSNLAAPSASWFLHKYGSNAKIAKDANKINKLKDISTCAGNVETKIHEIEALFKIKEIPIPDKDLFGSDFLNYIKE